MAPSRDRRAAGARRSEVRAGRPARLETRARSRTATGARRVTPPVRARAGALRTARRPSGTAARTAAGTRTGAIARAGKSARVPRRRPAPPRWRPKPNATRRRLIGLLVVLVLVFAVVAIRLVDLQALGRDRYTRLGLDQRVRTVQLAAERGSIFDRNGHDIAVSVPQQTVWANPRVVKDPAGYAAQLAPIVGVEESVLRDRLSQRDKGFVYLARKVDDATVLEVQALRLPGVDLVPESKRFYPAGGLGSSLLGFVGTDNDGLGGLEAQYDDRLAGKPGELSVELDPQGRQLPGGTRRMVPSQRGGDLVLTVDQSMQYHAEQVLTEGVTQAKAKGGVAIVVDVTTGNVLAMASVNGPDGARPAGPAPANERNRPVVDVYEPGSTNKVITVAGALEDGVITPDTTFPTPGELTIGGTVYKDEATHPSTMTVRDIVRQSSNVGTIQVARQLQKERFDAYLRAFGFGSPTGLAFPGEANGLVLPLSEYTDTSLASMPIGSGLAVTAMQMLNVYTTIANGGATRPPRLVTATVGPDGTRRDEPTPESRPVVSPLTAATVQGMLQGVVENGTGTKAQIAGYKVAGKTGTARKPPYDNPPYKYVASFAGFAPADAPRLAAIVVLDEPQDNYFGGQVAAPVFARIMEFALRAERVMPGGAAPAAPAGTPPGAKGNSSSPADTLTPTP